MDKHLKTLMDNYEAKEGTLLHFLHEKATFNESSFWDYYNSVISITKEMMGKPLNREITTAIVSTHSSILQSFLWHLTENDYYEITDYPYEHITLYVERLDFMIDGYLKGYIMSEKSFGEELKNPKSI
jgi:hypothetical protein